jgi:hypothetical protein
MRPMRVEPVDRAHVYGSHLPASDLPPRVPGIAETRERLGGLPLAAANARDAVHALERDANASDEDLRGNEITHAVASYTLDAAGALYEEHSPDTELLNPAPPET